VASAVELVAEPFQNTRRLVERCVEQSTAQSVCPGLANSPRMTLALLSVYGCGIVQPRRFQLRDQVRRQFRECLQLEPMNRIRALGRRLTDSDGLCAYRKWQNAEERGGESSQGKRGDVRFHLPPSLALPGPSRHTSVQSYRREPGRSL
jgi:hypothetical protein